MKDQHGARAPTEQIRQTERKLKSGEAVDHAEERSLERWLRQKKLVGRPSKLDKFSETGWRWLYYTTIFAFGLVKKSVFHQPLSSLR